MKAYRQGTSGGLNNNMLSFIFIITTSARLTNGCKKLTFKNVAIAIHCNWRSSNAAQSLSLELNFVADAKFEVAQPLRCHLILFY